MSPRLPRAPQTFEQLGLDFLADLELKRGLARNTVDAYRGDPVVLCDRHPCAITGSFARPTRCC
jgi:hypothetical protein